MSQPVPSEATASLSRFYGRALLAGLGAVPSSSCLCSTGCPLLYQALFAVFCKGAKATLVGLGPALALF